MVFTLHIYHTTLFFFFNDTPTTEIYTLSLHDALPISEVAIARFRFNAWAKYRDWKRDDQVPELVAKRLGLDRKSTRLNSSHITISYAVFCLKKKKKIVTECGNPSDSQ